MNTATNKPLNLLKLQFLNHSNGDYDVIANRTTGPDGVAEAVWTYPDDGKAYALSVRIDPNAVVKNRTMASQPVTLTVGKETRLYLTLQREESSTSHTITGTLLYNQAGVADKTIKIKVNEAEYTETTEVDGRFSLSLDLQPLNNEATTYQITANFEGDQTKTAEVYAKAPNGQDIIVCQTIQYGFKASSNSTSLTVEPQSSEAVVPTKTPEEMQQEAEQSGWLRPEPRFSWWYPWYRLDFIGE